METSIDNQFNTDTEMPAERPQFLKILCILSFVACGLLILLYGLGTMALAVNEEMIASFWGQVTDSNPALENVDPLEFCHQFGMYCIYSLIATIFSLIGVIMMWRLEKIGFYLYAIAELSTNFFSLDINMGEAEKSYAGLIFSIILDLVFIGMYFMNLKYMNKKNTNNFIQSGS